MKHILNIKEALNERTINQMHILYFPSNLNLEGHRLPYRMSGDDSTYPLFITYVTPQDAIRKMVEADLQYVYVLMCEGRIITQRDFEQELEKIGYNPDIVIPDLIERNRKSEFYKKDDIRFELLWGMKGFEYDDMVYIFDLQELVKTFNKMSGSEIERIRAKLKI